MPKIEWPKTGQKCPRRNCKCFLVGTGRYYRRCPKHGTVEIGQIITPRVKGGARREQAATAV